MKQKNLSPQEFKNVLELAVEHKMLESVRVVRASESGEWTISVVASIRGGISVISALKYRSQELKTYKTLDAVAEMLRGCGVTAFEVIMEGNQPQKVRLELGKS